MSFIAYLHFRGDCRDAMTTYQQIFGGRLDLTTYAETPAEGLEATPSAVGSERIMHAGLTLADGQMLMASDYPPGVGGDPRQGMAITHIAADPARAQAVFDALAEGGEVHMALSPTFYAEAFGMLRDRFGTLWYITTPFIGG